MFFFFIFLSLIFIIKSFDFKSPQLNNESKQFPSFLPNSSFLISWFQKYKLAIKLYQIPNKMPQKNQTVSSIKQESFTKHNTCLLDLPDLALDCILDKLSPSGLCNLATVCGSLKDKCSSDHLWEKHLMQKWGNLISEAAFREWQCHIASRNRSVFVNKSNRKGFVDYFRNIWPISWLKLKKFEEITVSKANFYGVNSFMSLYLSLENGNFWFPAQVYNRENGHVGFLLSCYDAQVSYDSQTDTFQARYSTYGRRMIEDGIHWDRLRAPPLSTPAHHLHLSDCLHDLKPGDHVEIQWRRSKEFPYGWWYAVVGHMESCDGNESPCTCQYNDTVVLEFNQYSPVSRWRRTLVNRKEHKEEGDEADGFYGGIRKIYKQEEISAWKNLWPSQIFE